MLEPVSEKKLAARLGLTRRDLRSVRKKILDDGDFIAEAGQEITITEAGIEKLEKELGPLPLDNPPLAVPLGPCAMLVTRVCPNHHLIQAQFLVDPRDSRRVFVSVKTNKNFVPGMKITARPKAPGSSAFELVGPCPRRRGKMFR
jgi:hypothetical protein